MSKRLKINSQRYKNVPSIQQHSNFDRLDENLLYQVMQMIGTKSYRVFGMIDKRCNELFEAHGLPKKTFYGYVSPSVAINLYDKYAREQKDLSKIIKGIAWHISHHKDLNLLRIALYKNDPHLLQEICNNIAATGRVEFFQIALQGITNLNRFKHKPDLSIEAGKNGHINFLEFLRHNQFTISREMSPYAANKGHMEVVLWAKNHGYVWNYCICAAAAAGGHFEILKWARSNGCEWDLWTTAHAAERGYLEILQWAREHGCEWKYQMVCENASKNGHLHVLDWVIEHDGSDDNELNGRALCACAAEGGQFDTLKWLRSRDYAWDEGTCYAACEGGHLKILQWALSEGCAWDEKDCYLCALCEEKHDIVEWMRDHGCPDYKLQYYDE